MYDPADEKIHAVGIVSSQAGKVSQAPIKRIGHTHFLKCFLHFAGILRFKLRDRGIYRHILRPVYKIPQLLTGQAFHILRKGYVFIGQ